ncbi:MAG: L-aspartate oxidase [Acidobacteriota bacterium]
MKNEIVDEFKETGAVVVGSGVAGMVTALKLSPIPVLLVTKARIGEGSSSYLAQGGVAAAVGADDSPELHSVDTAFVGKGLSDDRIVRIITESAPEEVKWLTDIGVRFDRDESGHYSLGKEGAHSRRRILHAHGDRTGRELVNALRRAVRKSTHIKIIENNLAADLVKKDGRITGVILRKGDGGWLCLKSNHTVLATGGIGSIYQQSTNPVESTGDGLAMAFRAGVRLADMEFVQFHPTALLSDQRPLPLLTEALRGEGALLVDDKGGRFMKDIHPLLELAPRDVVARAIWERRQNNIPVFLDCTLLWNADFPSRFPTVMSNCRAAGLDPSKDLLPVVPAAHYHIGGIFTDSDGRSSVPGLWACGEAAATLIHGANRLASNSLLEALIVGGRVAGSIKDTCESTSSGTEPREILTALTGEAFPGIRERVAGIMWERVGLLRSEKSLSSALAELDELDETLGERLSEEKNIVTVGKLIARSALIRRESRGVHYRIDYTESDPLWDKHICLEGDTTGTVRSGSDSMEVMK